MSSDDGNGVVVQRWRGHIEVGRGFFQNEFFSSSTPQLKIAGQGGGEEGGQGGGQDGGGGGGEARRRKKSAIQGRALLELRKTNMSHDSIPNDSFFILVIYVQLTICACIEREESGGIAPTKPVAGLY